MKEKTIREELAAYAHEAWSGWMKYMFGLSVMSENGSCTLLADLVLRWHRQMHTPYADLPENEKESDRKEADRVLAIMSPGLMNKTAMECMMADLNDISDGTDEEVRKELEEMGVDTKKAEEGLLETLREMMTKAEIVKPSTFAKVVTIGRYKHPEKIGYQGWIEDVDETWIMFVKLDGSTQTFLFRDKNGGLQFPWLGKDEG